MPLDSQRQEKDILGHNDGDRNVFCPVAWSEDCQQPSRAPVVAEGTNRHPQSRSDHWVPYWENVSCKQCTFAERRGIERGHGLRAKTHPRKVTNQDTPHRICFNSERIADGPIQV
jgi:hypothetical protein